MAIGDPYATLPELKTRLGITDEMDDVALTAALATASRNVEKYTGRQFNLAEEATARHFHRAAAHRVEVDDIATTDGLVVAVDTTGDGSYAATVAASAYLPEPVDGVVDGEAGWPFSELTLLSGAWPASSTRRPPIRVTAQWGWPAVPPGVKEATIVIAIETAKLKEAPFGAAGFGEFGLVRVRDNPLARRMIDPYRRHPVKVALWATSPRCAPSSPPG